MVYVYGTEIRDKKKFEGFFETRVSEKTFVKLFDCLSDKHTEEEN